jgi:hypothetical protein
MTFGPARECGCRRTVDTHHCHVATLHGEVHREDEVAELERRVL